jgi:hypothetical protein
MIAAHLRPAPFPFTAIFQNGPRRQGFASPRKSGAPLTAPGRSENLSQTRERGHMQSPNHSPCAASRGRPDHLMHSLPTSEIRPPPVDDVNKLQA